MCLAASFMLGEKLVVLMLDKTTTMSITASVSKVMDKGVSLVDHLGWFDKPTTCWVTPRPIALSNLFFNPLTIALFIASA